MSDEIFLRSFLAFTLRDSTKNTLSTIFNSKKFEHINATWVSPRNYHITFKFLGKVGIKRLESYSSKLNLLKKVIMEVEFRCLKLTSFKKNNRVIFFHLECNSDIVQHFFKMLEITDNQKPWTPHITVGRLKKAEKTKLLRDTCDSISFKSFSFTPKSFAIITSKLTSKGPEYSIFDEITNSRAK